MFPRVETIKWHLLLKDRRCDPRLENKPSSKIHATDLVIVVVECQLSGFPERCVRAITSSHMGWDKPTAVAWHLPKTEMLLQP